jgi:hypothetical protein
MTASEKRELLKKYMADCPACEPEDADAVPDADLDEWLTSHDKNWATPRGRLR